MAAVEILESPEVDVLVAPWLYLVEPNLSDEIAGTPWAPRRGVPVRARRAKRSLARRRRRAALIGLVLAGAFTVLALPGHTFGATDGAGLSNDLAGSAVLASGMDYVVQPGDSVLSIAREMNPVDPAEARTLLVRELHSSVVVPGEHVLIP